MNHSEIKDLMNEFVEFVLDGVTRSKNKDFELLGILDRLAVSLSCIQPMCDEVEYLDSPRCDYFKLRDEIGPNFPDYGFYNCVLDIEVSMERDAEFGIGDAIDDIVDIAMEFLEVLWRFENTSDVDALWHYADSYRIHWGEHLRELQLYIFCAKIKKS